MNALYIICGLGVASLVAELVHLKRWLIPFLAIGIAVAGIFALRDWDTSSPYFHDMVVIDHVSIAFNLLICVIGVLWFWMSMPYFHRETHVTDQAALVLFVMVGAMLLTAINNMAMLFLGIEILSLCLYVLAGSRKNSLLSNEAAFKYFLMGSFATGFLLMGIALVYGATGSFHINKISTFIQGHQGQMPGFFYAGVLLILVGMAFKVSAAPFHFWTPDVYEGSPTPITALMATIVKIAAFVALYRLLRYCFPNTNPSIHVSLIVLTVLTLVIANVTAVYQLSVKRMLAYSSVGHAGYLLLAMASRGTQIGNTTLYYLAAYSIATLAAFTVLFMVEQQGTLSVEGFNGLFKRNPFVAFAMTVALLSLAGIPPLAGFLGKYMIFSVAIASGYLNLVILGVLTSLIGVFYYFRVIIAIYFRDPAEHGAPLLTPAPTKILLGLLMAALLVLGVFPDLIMVL